MKSKHGDILDLEEDIVMSSNAFLGDDPILASE
jgi:hypothetical protein